MLAIATAIALALVLGWWLRGVVGPADAQLVVGTGTARSVGAEAQSPRRGPSASYPSAAADADLEIMVEPRRESRIKPADPSTAQYAPAPARAPLAASRAVPASSRADSPASAQSRGEDRVRMPETTSQDTVSRRDRANDPRSIAPRGRLTAPRSVSAQGRDFRPSFDCRRASSWVNRLVCNDEELAALDVRMSDAYGRAIATADIADEGRIDADQTYFLNQRARCRTAGCIERTYRIRIDELDTPY